MNVVSSKDKQYLSWHFLHFSFDLKYLRPHLCASQHACHFVKFACISELFVLDCKIHTSGFSTFGGKHFSCALKSKM